LASADRVAWRRGLGAATAATLIRGRWWLLALAAFLVRGGVLLAMLPLLTLPSPAQLASLVSPNLVVGGLTNPSAALVAILAGATVGLFLLIVVTTVLGTWLDLALVEAALADDELKALVPLSEAGDARSGREAGDRSRIPLDLAVEVRLTAHIPTALAIVAGAFVLRDVAMSELTSPSGTGPLLVRILGDAPVAAGAIVLAWFIGEAWGGLAVRRLASRPTALSALFAGLRDLARPGAIATAVLSTLAVGLPLVAVWLSAGKAFERLWPVLVSGSDDAIVGIGLLLLVASWAAGLWLLAIGLAFRSTAWTAEVLRTDPDPDAATPAPEGV
jgi:hypothetical protein